MTVVADGHSVGAGSNGVCATMLLFVSQECSSSFPSNGELHPTVRFPATKFQLMQQQVIVVIDSF
jgi:hypothetical protein